MLDWNSTSCILELELGIDECMCKTLNLLYFVVIYVTQCFVLYEFLSL